MSIPDQRQRGPVRPQQPPRMLAGVKPGAYPIRRNQAPGREWLVVEGVKKTFKKRMVVKGVSINLRRGESVGLLGPNGAGKTTVFYMITGLIKPDEGSVHMDGFNVT